MPWRGLAARSRLIAKVAPRLVDGWYPPHPCGRVDLPRDVGKKITPTTSCQILTRGTSATPASVT
jgi:hypothetical protein